MTAADDSLVLVFKALDSDNKGYITSDQFISTFRDYYNTNAPQGGRRMSTATADIIKLVKVLDPEDSGIIHFSDFKKAFEGSVVLDEDSSPKTNGKEDVFTDADNIRSSFISDGVENKTDDSGVHMHEQGILDGDNDSSLSVDPPHRSRRNFLSPEPCYSEEPTTTRARSQQRALHSSFNSSYDKSLKVASSHLVRGEIRSSWPKHSANPLLGARHGSDSPVSVSRSEIMMDDMEYSLEGIRDEMRRMQEQVENLHNKRNNEHESRLDRYRDENARLTAQVTVLEERLKEADARATRGLEAERQHMQTMMTRASRDHAQEVEHLRSRITTLETECGELRMEVGRKKAESQTSSKELHRATEALTEAQDQLSILQDKMTQLEEKHARELDLLRQDRDHAVHVLEELNGSIAGKQRGRIGSGSSASLAGAAGGSEVLARYQEVQEIVRRLTAENKSLRQQVEEAQEELLTRSLEEGRSLIRSSEKSWATEIDNCTKEEVIELLSNEKYTNEQLRKYIDNLITRIMERHPSLLEIANDPSAVH